MERPVPVPSRDSLMQIVALKKSDECLVILGVPAVGSATERKLWSNCPGIWVSGPREEKERRLIGRDECSGSEGLGVGGGLCEGVGKD